VGSDNEHRNPEVTGLRKEQLWDWAVIGPFPCAGGFVIGLKSLLVKIVI
jgi:hypothetical protein